jgi:hypothetical protein
MAGVYAYMVIGGKNEGSDVQTGVFHIGNPPLVKLYKLLQRIDAEINVNTGDAETVSGIVHASEIVVGSEKLNRAVGGAVSLQAFKNLLGIVENHAGGVKLKGAVGYDTGIDPALPVNIVHNEHVIGKICAEGQIVKIRQLLGLCIECYFDLFH